MHLDRTPQCNIIGFRCVRNGALKDENLMSRRVSVKARTKNVPLHPNISFYLEPDPIFPTASACFSFLSRKQNSLKVYLPEIVQCVICLSSLVCQSRQTLKHPVFSTQAGKEGKDLTIIPILCCLCPGYFSFSPPCI